MLAKAVLSHLGLTTPVSLRGNGGVAKPGGAGTGERRVLIDQANPTDRHIVPKRPDLMVRLDRERRMVLYEVACARDPLVKRREEEKKAENQDLAADLTKEWPG